MAALRRGIVVLVSIWTGALGCQQSTSSPRHPLVDVAAPPATGADATAGTPKRTAPAQPAAAPRSARAAKAAPVAPTTPPLDFGRCLRWRMCQYEGLCSPTEEGNCIAAHDDDCRPSDACLGGRCTARQGQCVAASDQDCRGSLACTGWGRCSFDGRDACMATSVHDCAASTRCQRLGECQLRDGACTNAVTPPARP